MTDINPGAHLSDEDESYYVSMTDLMVGVIFIFVIILMYFALRFQEAEETRKEKVATLENSQLARTEILIDLRQALEEEGIEVEIDEENGTLHLPENVLFRSGSDTINADGRRAVRVLGGALSKILPCYTPARTADECAGRVDAQIDSVFIEGHTDDVPVRANQRFQDNWELSTRRAISTFSTLRDEANLLDAFLNYRGHRLFSVSGYSEFRPREPNDTEEGRAANRRIDLRVLMRTPRKDDIDDVDQSLQEAINGVP